MSIYSMQQHLLLIGYPWTVTTHAKTFLKVWCEFAGAQNTIAFGARTLHKFLNILSTVAEYVWWLVLYNGCVDMCNKQLCKMCDLLV